MNGGGQTADEDELDAMVEEHPQQLDGLERALLVRHAGDAELPRW